MMFQELYNLFGEHFCSDQLRNDETVDVNCPGENDNETDNADESTVRLISDRVTQYFDHYNSNERTDEELILMN